MNQLNKIKLEEDPMANSWENNKMVITAEFATLARTLISSGTTTSELATSQLLQLNPDFQQDQIFRELFPMIFNMELCKWKLKVQNG